MASVKQNKRIKWKKEIVLVPLLDNASCLCPHSVAGRDNLQQTDFPFSKQGVNVSCRGGILYKAEQLGQEWVPEA